MKPKPFKRTVSENRVILNQTVVTSEQWDYLHSLPEGLTISRVIREALELYRKEHKNKS